MKSPGFTWEGAVGLLLMVFTVGLHFSSVAQIIRLELL